MIRLLCCSVLQCVAVCCCSVLQCVAVFYSVLQYVAVCYRYLWLSSDCCVAVCCSVLQISMAIIRLHLLTVPSPDYSSSPGDSSRSPSRLSLFLSLSPFLSLSLFLCRSTSLILASLSLSRSSSLSVSLSLLPPARMPAQLELTTNTDCWDKIFSRDCCYRVANTHRMP